MTPYAYRAVSPGGQIVRGRLDARDLTAASALYVYRPTVRSKDVFAQLVEEQKVSPQKLGKVEEIGIEEFIAKVLPTAKDVRALVEPSHAGNFVTLTGPAGVRVEGFDLDALAALMRRLAS